MPTRRLKMLLIMTVVLALGPAMVVAQERLAVLDLRAEDDRVDARDVAQIGDELRTQIVMLGSRRGTFKCLDRQEMRERLKEQAFSLTDCVSNECVIQAGRALTARKMVAGQVGKVGTLFRISAHLLDVETGEISQAASVQVSGGIEEVLRTGVSQIVAKLFGLSETTPPKPAVTDPTRPSVQPPQVTDTAELFSQATKAYTAGKWLEALRLYERVDALEPGNPVVAMRIKECAPKADYESWRQDALRKRTLHVETAQGLLDANRACEAGKYALMAFAGDWEWKQGRDLIEGVIAKSSTPDQCCDVEAAFDSERVPQSYRDELKAQGKAVCAEFVLERADALEKQGDKVDAGSLYDLVLMWNPGNAAAESGLVRCPPPLCEMVRMPGGTFIMGSLGGEPGRRSNEGPQFPVTVSPFRMGKYEVTQGQWEAVMGNNPSDFNGGNRPVENVSWYDAVEFCNRLSDREALTRCYARSGSSTTCNWEANGYRLPTEAEREYACRAGTTTEYNTGSGESALERAGYYSGNTGTRTHSVGQMQGNAWGLYDMHGNVEEWCWDWYAAYSLGPETDSRGPSSGSNRVGRGGSWNDGARACRSASREWYNPGYRSNSLGFRLARR